MSLYLFLEAGKNKNDTEVSVDSSWKSIILVFYISFPNVSDVSVMGP